MNIWLPIITNTLIALIIVAGIFVGKRNGWKLQLSKLIFVCAGAVGAYFLTPVISNLLLKIEVVSQITTNISCGLAALNSLTLAIMFLLIYSLISIIILIIRVNIEKAKQIGINAAKVKRARGIDRKTDRALRKQEREIAKMQKKMCKQNKGSQAFGIIFGILIAIIVAFAVIMPTKYIFKAVKEVQPEIEQIEAGYEFTPIGQLDKATDIVDMLVKGE